MEIEQQSIDSLKAKIVSDKFNLDRIKNQLNQYEKLNDIERYNDSVDNFNRLLDFYKVDLSDYENKITSYNAKIDEANTLIKRSSSRWYIIPIPAKGTKSKL